MSSSHIACRLVNSLGTLSLFLLVRVLFRHSFGILVVCLRTGSQIDIGPRDTSVPGRFDRRPGSLGSAWSQVEVFRSRNVRQEEEVLLKRPRLLTL